MAALQPLPGQVTFLGALLFLAKSFLHGFSSMEKHCSYISFRSIALRWRRASEGGALEASLFQITL